MIKLCVHLDVDNFVDSVGSAVSGVCQSGYVPIVIDFANSLVSMPSDTDFAAIWALGFASPIVIYYSAWGINQVVSFFNK